MSATIPTSEPSQIRAGETLQFTKTLDDYSATDGWSITYSFRGNQATAIDFTSTADGKAHAVSVPFADTAGWLPGTYSGVGTVTDGTTKKTIWTGTLKVLPNLAALEAGTDTRTQARRTLDNINAVLEGRATSTILKSEIEGTNIERIPMTDLIKLKDRYEIIVKNEEAGEKLSQGLATGRTIFTRFSRP